MSNELSRQLEDELWFELAMINEDWKPEDNETLPTEPCEEDSTLEDDILQQVGNEIQETLLLHAPENWSDERLEAIEEEVVQNTRAALDTLSTEELQSPGVLRLHIAQAVADAKKLIHERA